MNGHEPVRWGILGTARIASSAFLPALRTAGGGISYAVAGRDLQRTERFAADHGVEHAREGYERIIGDERIDAVYIPLPNSLHVEWTVAALRAGKAVLCEKPLGVSVADTEVAIGAAHDTAGLLWEAFVFPFHRQTELLSQIITAGTIGEPWEVEANFHFTVDDPDNIRLSPGLGGGALRDVGCYCVRIARLVFQSDPDGAIAVGHFTPAGLDAEVASVLSFPHDRQLVLSCSLRRPYNLLARVLGSEGEIRLSRPYHPIPGATLTVRHAGGSEEVHGTGSDEPSFTPALRHIHAVLWGRESPRHLAVADALGNAVGVDLIEHSARTGRFQSSSSS